MNLRELRDSVAAGTFLANGAISREMLAYEAFSGSLDAAKALHEALLPGWKVAGIRQEDSGKWWIELREGYITSYNRVVIAPHHFDADNPARAWLLAILDALIQEEAAMLTQADGEP